MAILSNPSFVWPVTGVDTSFFVTASNDMQLVELLPLSAIQQIPYNQQQQQNLEYKQLLLQQLESAIDAKILELKALDKSGLADEMILFTEQQFEALRSAPRHEAVIKPNPSPQLELPLETAGEITF